jgi:two-component system nitrogen regulation response regulator GlnG
MTGATILIADDDAAIRTVLQHAFDRLGYEVRSTGNAAALWHWVEEGQGDVVITDVVLPDENGLDLIPRIKRLRPNLRIIAMSAQNTVLTALKAAERGAFEYLAKPFDLPELVNVVERALADARSAPTDGAEQPRSEERLPLIGRSPAMQELYRVLGRLIATDLTVIVTGESGTGKELVARVLHDYGKRRNGPFVAINMAAIPRDLVESELFGYERGAFTGANARGIGRFEQAQGGTLFLDEIGDMPVDAQTRLLRVLQDGRYTTIGGRTPIHADVRIIAATHRDLMRMVRQGRFREDLYYRLNVVSVRLPPLRERVQDIPELVEHFFAEAAKQGFGYKTVDKAALSRLTSHHWPGNVRELENMVRRFAALSAEEVIGGDLVERELVDATQDNGDAGEGREATLSIAVERHLSRYFAAHEGAMPPAGLYDRVLREIERPLIRLTLNATRGNQIKAARLLGLNRNTLRKKIRDLDIEVGRGLKSAVSPETDRPGQGAD